MRTQEDIEVMLTMVRQRNQGLGEMAVVQTLYWVLEEDDGNVMNPATYLSMGDSLLIVNNKCGKNCADFFGCQWVMDGEECTRPTGPDYINSDSMQESESNDQD